MTTLIPKGTHLPVKVTQTFSTFADNQSGVFIQVYVGPHNTTDRNELRFRFNLDGIPPMPRGQPQIDVTFSMDVEGALAVTAVEKSTGTTILTTGTTITTTTTRTLPQPTPQPTPQQSQQRRCETCFGLSSGGGVVQAGETKCDHCKQHSSTAPAQPKPAFAQPAFAPSQSRFSVGASESAGRRILPLKIRRKQQTPKHVAPSSTPSAASDASSAAQQRAQAFEESLTPTERRLRREQELLVRIKKGFRDRGAVLPDMDLSLEKMESMVQVFGF